MKKFLAIILIGASILTVGCSLEDSPSKAAKESVDNFIEVKLETLDENKGEVEVEDEIVYDLMSEVLDEVRVNYGKVVVEGNRATVDLTVTGPSYEMVFIDALPQVYNLINLSTQGVDDEVMTERIDEIIETSLRKTEETSREKTINLTKVNGRWIIDDLSQVEGVLLDMYVCENNNKI